MIKQDWLSGFSRPLALASLIAVAFWIGAVQLRSELLFPALLIQAFGTMLPLIYAYLKEDRLFFVRCVMFSIVLVFLLTGSMGLEFVLLFLPLSVCNGYLVSRQVSWRRSTDMLLLVSLVGSGLLVVLLLRHQPETVDYQTLLTSFQADSSLVKDLAPADRADVVAKFSLLLKWYFRLSPSLILFGNFLLGIFGYYFAFRWIRKLRVPLASFRVNEQLIFPLLLGLAGVGFLSANSFWYYAALNLACFFALVFFLQGIGVVAHFCQRFHFPRWASMLLSLVIMVQVPLLLLVWFLGMFDVWVDFRKPVEPAQAG